MSYIGKEPIVGNFQKCDAITVVNGQAAYTLQVSSTNVVPESANHMLVSLNGILQAPVTSFTVSGSTLTFASNLATGDVIDFIILLGNVLDLGTPSDGTVTAAKVANDLISGKTALTTEPAATDEFLVSDAGTLKRIDYSLISNRPAFLAVKTGSSDQTFSTSFTKITFDSETYDTDSMFASNRFTPTIAGKYLFTFQIKWNPSGSNMEDAYAAIYKNGSELSNYAKDQQFAGVDQFQDGQDNTLSVSFTDIANGSGDYYELYAYFSENAIVKDAHFSGHKLIGV